MDADRDVRVDLDDGVHHAGQHDVVGVAPGAARGLQDHRRVAGVGGRHDGQRLFHVAHVERRHAIAALGGVVEQLAQGDTGHDFSDPTLKLPTTERAGSPEAAKLPSYVTRPRPVDHAQRPLSQRAGLNFLPVQKRLTPQASAPAFPQAEPCSCMIMAGRPLILAKRKPLTFSPRTLTKPSSFEA